MSVNRDPFGIFVGLEAKGLATESAPFLLELIDRSDDSDRTETFATRAQEGAGRSPLNPLTESQASASWSNTQQLQGARTMSNIDVATPNGFKTIYIQGESRLIEVFVQDSNPVDAEDIVQKHELTGYALIRSDDGTNWDILKDGGDPGYSSASNRRLGLEHAARRVLELETGVLRSLSFSDPVEMIEARPAEIEEWAQTRMYVDGFDDPRAQSAMRNAVHIGSQLRTLMNNFRIHPQAATDVLNSVARLVTGAYLASERYPALQYAVEVQDQEDESWSLVATFVDEHGAVHYAQKNSRVGLTDEVAKHGLFVLRVHDLHADPNGDSAIVWEADW